MHVQHTKTGKGGVHEVLCVCGPGKSTHLRFQSRAAADGVWPTMQCFLHRKTAGHTRGSVAGICVAGFFLQWQVNSRGVCGKMRLFCHENENIVLKYFFIDMNDFMG